MPDGSKTGQLKSGRRWLGIAIFGRNQFGVIGEKIPAEKNFSGSSGAPEDENRLEIAQLLDSL